MRSVPIALTRFAPQPKQSPRWLSISGGFSGSGPLAVSGERAVAKLKAALRPLGIEPALEEQVISQASFQADPSESNRVWISGRPMEEWLGARVGSTPCCSVCGDSECRTVEVGGTTFEALPEQLIIRAALVAASTLIDVTDDSPPERTSMTGA